MEGGGEGRDGGRGHGLQEPWTASVGSVPPSPPLRIAAHALPRGPPYQLTLLHAFRGLSPPDELWRFLISCCSLITRM